MSQNINVVWSPFPGTSQELVASSPAKVTLHCGTRGGGKTDSQIMRFRSQVGRGYGKFWRGIIFDREYKNLDDIVSKTKYWFPQFKDGAKFHASKGEYKWTWPSGEELLLRAAKDVKDYDDFHGHEYTFIGWNELTKWPDRRLFDKMMSTLRSSFVSDGTLSPIPLWVHATTNPHGPGHNWVKQQFIDPAPYGKLVKTVTTIESPATGELVDVETTQVAIFSHWRENPLLPLDYIAGLVNESDDSLREAWANGNWDIVAGGAFNDVFKRNIHIIPRFVIPPTWRLDRAFDWGSSHPFYVGWFAEANGDEAQIIFNGQEYSFCPTPGSLILFNEWYGTKSIGSNVGLKLSTSEIAQGILDREELMRETGWISQPVYAGPADNQIANVNEITTLSIKAKMAEAGVEWTESDKRPGSRRIGLQIVRDLFRAAIDGEGPALYITTNCRGAISTVPNLPRDEKDPDDVDTSAEDHPYDVIRYRALKSFGSLARNVAVRF